MKKLVLILTLFIFGLTTCKIKEEIELPPPLDIAVVFAEVKEQSIHVYAFTNHRLARSKDTITVKIKNEITGVTWIWHNPTYHQKPDTSFKAQNNGMYTLEAYYKDGVYRDTLYIDGLIETDVVSEFMVREYSNHYEVYQKLIWSSSNKEAIVAEEEGSLTGDFNNVFRFSYDFSNRRVMVLRKNGEWKLIYRQCGKMEDEKLTRNSIMVNQEVYSTIKRIRLNSMPTADDELTGNFNSLFHNANLFDIKSGKTIVGCFVYIKPLTYSFQINDLSPAITNLKYIERATGKDITDEIEFRNAPDWGKKKYISENVYHNYRYYYDNESCSRITDRINWGPIENRFNAVYNNTNLWGIFKMDIKYPQDTAVVYFDSY